MALKRRECVEYFVEGRQAWRVGLVGLSTRLRTILFTGLVTVVTMGAPFWWPRYFPSKASIDLRYVLIATVVLVGIAVTSAFVYLRWRSRRSLDMKYHLHELAHRLRDQNTAFSTHAIATAAEKPGGEALAEAFRSAMDAVCQHVVDYFSLLTNDRTTAASIRLALYGRDEAGEDFLVYRTAGQSSTLAHRAKTSDDIPAVQGVPRFLVDKKCRGVLIYNDIEEATRVGAFVKTQNEVLHPKDISTMMVAPLNAWDGQSETMIGILYVSSPNNGVFSAHHVDSLRFIADSLSNAISGLANQLELAGVVDYFRRR